MKFHFAVVATLPLVQCVGVVLRNLKETGTQMKGINKSKFSEALETLKRELSTATKELEELELRVLFPKGKKCAECLKYSYIIF